MMIKRATMLLCAALLALGCGGEQKVSDEDVQKVLYPQLIDMLENPGKHPPVLIDVRPREAYLAGHIPGAINISTVDLDADHPSLSNKKSNVIVYSESWTDALSAGAAKKLMRQGMDKERVFDFRGGMDYWDKQGGEIVRN